MTVVLTSLGVLLMGARADSSGPVMPEAGTIVVGSPAAASEVERLSAVYRPLDSKGKYRERVVEDAADMLKDRFRAAGWAAHDTNNAVVSYVVDTPDGQVELDRAAKVLEKSMIFNPKAPWVEEAIERVAEPAGRRGLVQVITEPAEVSVLLGKDVRGRTQVEFWCAAGQYELTLRKAGYRSQTVTITVEPQKVTPVKARMAR